MRTLNRDFLLNSIAHLKNIEIGPINSFPEKIIQFGEGNFLRAFIDWQINELIKKELFDGKVVVIQPRECGMVEELNKQDGLYTLLQRGIYQGKIKEKSQIITCINRCINPYKDWQDYLELAGKPELRFIISNTTEAGIIYEKEPIPVMQCPKSFPSKVTILLYRRYEKFHGEKEKGMVIIPCELIENNGDELKSCIIKHAVDWNLDENFLKWIEENNYFCNTLVDRIVPGYPKEEIINLTDNLGYEDRLLVTSEIYHLFVIQGSVKIQEELPLKKAGLNVIWTDKINEYRTMKVRILNGTHTMFSIPAFLYGKNTVKECIEDEVILEFIKKGLFDEILPTLEFPKDSTEEFAKNVLERFKNPFIKHYLLTLSLNSISKFRVRVLPSLLKYFEMNKTLPKILTFSLASLIAYYKGRYDEKCNYYGFRNNEIYFIKDESSVINVFNEAFKDKFESEKACPQILSNEHLWGMNLSIIPNLNKEITTYLRDILNNGTNTALKRVINL